MDVSLCKRCGFDENTIAERLSLLELGSPGTNAQGRALQAHIIRPNIDAILDRLYESLIGIEAFDRIVGQYSDVSRVRGRQKQYLLNLGIDIRRVEYFEERLRVGAVHQRVGVPHGLYQCTCQGLQSLLIEYIPHEMRSDASAFEKMIRFILKVTALDMSLAVDSYCTARVSGLKKSLMSERGESKRLRKIAVTDWLTNLYNHSFSRRCLEAALERAGIDGSPLCVIMADLDHFKEINDAHGHLVGDEVLRITAGRMLSAARNDDEICRYGGEEFLFILRDTGIEGAAEVAERVRTRIGGDAMHSGDTQLTVSISLGIAQARESDTVDTLIERADAALYAAKAAGRDCVRQEALEIH